MHEIDIWSIPRGHQDDAASKEKKWKKFVKTDTKQIDHQLWETMIWMEEKDWALT
jgi:hypothetical protein